MTLNDTDPLAGGASFLLERAREASRHAFAPFSSFPVGAAVLDESGRTHIGCNVESDTYGLTICAERNAIAAAVVTGARRLRAVAVYTPTLQPTYPCGACRQLLFEFGGEDMIVILGGESGIQITEKMGDLLPHGFRLQNKDLL